MRCFIYVNLMNRFIEQTMPTSEQHSNPLRRWSLYIYFCTHWTSRHLSTVLSSSKRLSKFFWENIKTFNFFKTPRISMDKHKLAKTLSQKGETQIEITSLLEISRRFVQHI